MRDIVNGFEAHVLVYFQARLPDLSGEGGREGDAHGGARFASDLIIFDWTSKGFQVYWALRDEVVAHEQVLLRGMAFDAELTKAYSNLTELAWMLGSNEKGVLQLAWTLLNDAFRCRPSHVSLKPFTFKAYHLLV